MKTALITGVTGQDGSYLAELLLDKGYQVIGISRRVSVQTTERIKHILNHPNFLYQEGDICDGFCIGQILINYKVDELYNLAAQSHVKTSFDQPNLTTDINYFGVLNILNAVAQYSPQTRVYQASTSEMFGSCYDIKEKKKYQDENTRMEPQSPYAVAKLAAHHLVRLYRDSYGIFACAGILFNHESPRRGDQFVTKKITNWIRDFDIWRKTSDIQKASLEINDEYIVAKSLDTSEVVDQFPKLRLGNLDAYRDWGLASDYVEAMYLMLQADKPEDYVISTGETHTVREFLVDSFLLFNIKDWSSYIVIDPKFYRPAEVDYLCGCSEKANRDLGWVPKHTFKELVRIMNET